MNFIVLFSVCLISFSLVLISVVLSYFNLIKYDTTMLLITLAVAFLGLEVVIYFIFFCLNMVVDTIVSSGTFRP
jgi:hypothetical protein